MTAGECPSLVATPRSADPDPPAFWWTCPIRVNHITFRGHPFRGRGRWSLWRLPDELPVNQRGKAETSRPVPAWGAGPGNAENRSGCGRLLGWTPRRTFGSPSPSSTLRRGRATRTLCARRGRWPLPWRPSHPAPRPMPGTRLPPRLARSTGSGARRRWWVAAGKATPSSRWPTVSGSTRAAPRTCRSSPSSGYGREPGCGPPRSAATRRGPGRS